MATSNKHTHQIVKSGPVWKCVHGECSFFVYFKQEYVLVGRASLCNECGEKFALDEDSMREDLPRCPTCRFPEMAQLQIDTVSKENT